MPPVRDLALCLRVHDWSETSQTVALFARDLGLVRALAKGARRERAPFSGGLEPLSLGHVVVHPRPVPALATLAAWDLARTFPILRRSLPAFHAGFYFADLTLAAVRDADPHPRLLDALLDALGALEGSDRDRIALVRFQWATLTEAGYRPDLRSLPAPASPARAFGFDPALGVLTADPGAPPPSRSRSRSPHPDIWRVRADTVAFLRSLAATPAPSDPPAAPPPPVVLRAARFLHAYLSRVLDAPLATAAAVFPDAPSRPAPPRS